MHRFFILLLSCLLLIACQAAEEPAAPAEKALSAYATSANSTYTFELKSATDVYEQGAPIDVVATLTNNSEQPIDIGHAASWVSMSVTNLTKDYHFGSAMNTPYIVTTMQAGEMLAEPYEFSGASYSDGQDGQRYSDDDFMQMATLQFPAGTYEITASFSFTNEATGETTNEALSVVFAVK